MKKKIGILISVLALALTMGCGDEEPNYPSDNTSISTEADDSNLAMASGFGNNAGSQAGDPASASGDYSNNYALLATWEGEDIFIVWYTFKEDGTYEQASDGGAQYFGTYTFDGTNVVLTSSDDHVTNLTFDGINLVDDRGTVYVNMDELGELINGYWEGVNTPPNDWFFFEPDGSFCCYRDNEVIEGGYYTLSNKGLALTFTGSDEYLFLSVLEDRTLEFEDTNGLRKAADQDFIPDWVRQAADEYKNGASKGEQSINGIWKKDKLMDTWIVIRNMGQEWSLYDSMGEEAVKGTVALSGDNFALYDEKGDTYMEVGLIGTDGLMDMMYQETYTKVDSLPDKFPGQLAKEVGFGSIEGDWFYQQSTRENTADYKTVAYVSVLSDGNYEIRWLEDLSEATGTIMPVETENPDGTKGIAYIFYEGGNNLWQVIDAPDTAEAEEIAIDQEGLERFLRNYGEGD